MKYITFTIPLEPILSKIPERNQILCFRLAGKKWGGLGGRRFLPARLIAGGKIKTMYCWQYVYYTNLSIKVVG